MQINRRIAFLSLFAGCIFAALLPDCVLAEPTPPDEFALIAWVLRAKVNSTRSPVLIASARFISHKMAVLPTQLTPMQKAAHIVELPYLVPPPDRLADAEALAAAYNRGLYQSPSPLTENAAFDFPYRLLSAQLVKQFEALYPGGNVYSEDLERQRRAVSKRDRLFFDGSTVVWSVGRVTFAPDGVLAIVGLRSSGGSCWSEEWIVLERFGSAWRELRWGTRQVTCA